MEVKCIIFDCDGVLVDTEKIGNGILLEMAAEHGFEMEIEDAYRNFNGRNLKDCFRHIEEAIDQKLPETFEAEYRQRSFNAFKTQVKPMEGVVSFIENLKIPYCVASSGPVEKIRLNLEVAGLLDKFENKIFSSYQINSWKPEPGIFLHAAKEMGFDVKDCIVLEDSKAGVKSGISGGFKVFGLANGFNNTDLEDEGAVLFHTYKELSEIIAV
ncbi:HAD superfamily hydrolase (TIGR01509 family) [Flavobacterium sp. HSC-32F16]|uniref:HAD family hydrolase n=1 Tax=Flavobacterium sp. HSC-32F16 TaxID=2910964 RepID=UPI0020A516D3|nr:HAD family hydrolase [Flavobacterium sp. HSC-32F16]MCP2028280.1 HAD superfamily hydrolase (TIGR01509 family) [Flavobacterium sp. HSC-32F16]